MKPLIRLTSIGRHYKMGRDLIRAVHDVSLSVFPGENIAVMGTSGSGKSTLLSLIGCLDRPTSGSYLLNGEEVCSFTEDARSCLRNQFFGFIFQSFNLLSKASALDNVELPLLCGPKHIPAKDRHRTAIDCLKQVGLLERAAHFPNQLSGGQQQRVAIARALVNRPQVILADEPTGNLDSQASRDIMDRLRHLNHCGTTLIVVTHDEGLAKSYCKRVLAMRDGRLVRDCPVP